MSQTVPMLINLAAALLGAFGQYLYKTGAARLKAVPLHQNWQLACGALLFCGVMVMFVWAFKLGGRLSVTYPMYATTFVWGSLLGILLDREPFSYGLLLGTLLVVGGLGCIAFATR
jgi:drug/metabolite transporter (DMT)-like permease